MLGRCKAPPGDGPPESGGGTQRAAAARRVAGEGGASPEGAEPAQLNVPGSAAGAIAGADIPPGIVEITPSSQQGAGPQAGPQGSQAGPQGAAIGGAQGSDRRPHGERNSMNDGRRQPLPPPKQLLQPGAAASEERAIARQRNRDMRGVSSGRRARGPAGRGRVEGKHGVVADATKNLPHDFRAAPPSRWHFPVPRPDQADASCRLCGGEGAMADPGPGRGLQATVSRAQAHLRW